MPRSSDSGRKLAESGGVVPQTIEWERGPRRVRRFFLVLLLIIGFILALTTSLSYYVDLLWFGSLGYGDVFRKAVSLQWLTFAAFFTATFLILYGWFLALQRSYRPDALSGGLIFIGRQAVRLPVERILRLIALIASLVIAGIAGTSMMSAWQTFAVYWYAPRASEGVVDPIFNRALGFYLFSLSAWQLITGWLLTL